MAPKPSSAGRFLVGFIGLCIGSYITFKMTSDLELIKFEPATSPYDENGQKKKFKVTFKEMKPVELKPEAVERYKSEIAAKEKLMKQQAAFDKDEVEQIIQEPTS